MIASVLDIDVGMNGIVDVTVSDGVKEDHCIESFEDIEEMMLEVGDEVILGVDPEGAFIIGVV